MYEIDTGSDCNLMCKFQLRQKDECIKCRFFVVPFDSPPLLGMLDIELLSILRKTCDIIGEPHESRKFDLQTIKTSVDQVAQVAEKTKPYR